MGLWIGLDLISGVVFPPLSTQLCLRGKIVGDGGDEVELVVVGGDDVSSQ